MMDSHSSLPYLKTTDAKLLPPPSTVIFSKLIKGIKELRNKSWENTYLEAQQPYLSEGK